MISENHITLVIATNFCALGWFERGTKTRRPTVRIISTLLACVLRADDTRLIVGRAYLMRLVQKPERQRSKFTELAA